MIRASIDRDDFGLEEIATGSNLRAYVAELIGTTLLYLILVDAVGNISNFGAHGISHEMVAGEGGALYHHFFQTGSEDADDPEVADEAEEAEGG